MDQQDLLDQFDMDLLNAENAPLLLDMELEVIAIVNKCIRKTGMGRDRVIDRVNLCLRDTGRKVTKVQMNKWLAVSQDNSIPAWVMPAICWAVNSIEPLDCLLNPLGYKPADLTADWMRKKAESDIQSKLRKKESMDIEKAMLILMESRNANK